MGGGVGGSAGGGGGGGMIIDVAGREQEDARPAFGIGQCVDFGRSPAARAADGFLEGPLFRPLPSDAP